MKHSLTTYYLHLNEFSFPLFFETTFFLLNHFIIISINSFSFSYFRSFSTQMISFEIDSLRVEKAFYISSLCILHMRTSISFFETFYFNKFVRNFVVHFLFKCFFAIGFAFHFIVYIVFAFFTINSVCHLLLCSETTI